MEDRMCQIHAGLPFPTEIAPEGYTPAQIRRAYGFSARLDGRGQTIGLVVAGDHPRLLEDLGQFSRFFALPPACVRICRQGDPPVLQSCAWRLEAALDVQWAHALAPGARLLVVCAASAQMRDLIPAACQAARLGAGVVGMSWGNEEFPEQAAFDQMFAQCPDTLFVAAAGDWAAVPFYPAASPQVLSVGGTRAILSRQGDRIREMPWHGGAGASRYSPVPPFQQNLPEIAAVSSDYRVVPDVSFCGDPDFGAAVYVSDPQSGRGQWQQAAGTSFAAAAWTAILAGARQLGAKPEIADLYRLARQNPAGAAGSCFFAVGQPATTRGGKQVWVPGAGLGPPKVAALQYALAEICKNRDKAERLHIE